MQITIPELAESITEGDIGSWLKKDGEVVRRDDAILELETDKATVEIVAETDGVLKILVPAGATVQVGDVVGEIVAADATAESADESSASTVPLSEPEPSPPPVSESEASPPTPGEPEPTAAPSAPREPATVPTPVAEAAPEPARVVPSVPEVRGAAPPADEPGVRRVRMSRLRRRIAERLVEAQRTAAILTTFNEIDMSAVIELRRDNQPAFEERHDVRLGFMSLFARATILALREQPELNAFIDGDEIVYHDHVHLGIAVGTPGGLVVPVLRHAERMTFAETEKSIQDLAGRARDGNIAIGDLEDGTFTISNGGIYGSLASTPILNPPQSGILGMHKIMKRAVVLDDDSIVPRPMMFVALSYDHRIVDGEKAVTFLVRVKERLEEPVRLLLDA